MWKPNEDDLRARDLEFLLSDRELSTPSIPKGWGANHPFKNVPGYSTDIVREARLRLVRSWPAHGAPLDVESLERTLDKVISVILDPPPEAKPSGERRRRGLACEGENCPNDAMRGETLCRGCEQRERVKILRHKVDKMNAEAVGPKPRDLAALNPQHVVYCAAQESGNPCNYRDVCAVIRQRRAADKRPVIGRTPSEPPKPLELAKFMDLAGRNRVVYEAVHDGVQWFVECSDAEVRDCKAALRWLQWDPAGPLVGPLTLLDEPTATPPKLGLRELRRREIEAGRRA